jgi:hypothetical protein
MTITNKISIAVDCELLKAISIDRLPVIADGRTEVTSPSP